MTEYISKKQNEFLDCFVGIDENWKLCSFGIGNDGCIVIILSTNIKFEISRNGYSLIHGTLTTEFEKDADVKELGILTKFLLLQDQSYLTFLNNKKLDRLAEKILEFQTLSK